MTAPFTFRDRNPEQVNAYGIPVPSVGDFVSERIGSDTRIVQVLRVENRDGKRPRIVTGNVPVKNEGDWYGIQKWVVLGPSLGTDERQWRWTKNGWKPRGSTANAWWWGLNLTHARQSLDPTF